MYEVHGAELYRGIPSHITHSNLSSLCTCEKMAENSAFGSCFRRSFHRARKEDKMISSAFSAFSNVEVSQRPS